MKRKNSIKRPKNPKIYQIRDRQNNVVVFNEDFCDYKPLTLTHFTRDEAEEIIADSWLQHYKVGEEKDFYKMGWHIVKDKARAKEIYQQYIINNNKKVF